MLLFDILDYTKYVLPEMSSNEKYIKHKKKEVHHSKVYAFGG